MTSEQLLRCQHCLNKKKEISSNPNEICNLRGHRLEPEEVCRYYERDKSILEPLDHFSEGEFIQSYGQPRPNSERAKWAMILVGAVLFTYLISMYSSYLQIELLQDFMDDVYVSDEAIDSNDNRQRFVGFLFIVVFITSAVFFIRWFRRAYYNLWMRTGNIKLGEGWAAGAWFVPIISLYRPVQIMKEMHEGTIKQLKLRGEQQFSTTQWYILWWILWVTTNFISHIIVRRFFNSDTVEGLLLSTQLEIGSNVLDVVLSVVTLIMIKDYKDKEDRLEFLEGRR